MASVDGRQMWLAVEPQIGCPELHVYSARGEDPRFDLEFRWKSRLDNVALAMISQKSESAKVSIFPCALFPYGRRVKYSSHCRHGTTASC